MTQLPSNVPTGWFQVAWSADIADRAVVPLHYFGRDLVAFRNADGTVSVLDAHCEHLGASLAHGGCVVDDGIQCPFHGWVWDGQGRNVRIPYEKRPNRGRRIRFYPVVEANDTVFIWHDVTGAEPRWPLPDGFDVLGEHVSSRTYHEFTADCRTRFERVKVHPQVIAENAVDPHHFRFVHHTPISPHVLRETRDETTWAAKVGFGRRWADGVDRPGDTLNTIEIHWSGVGVSFNAEHLREGVRVISINATPVDDTTSDIFASYWISDEGADDFAERLDVAKRALPDDIRIWEHQRYTDKPALAPSEAKGFQELRAWARGFYPEPAGHAG
ncbi:Rieske 2Fe-2S domain-containing protein [Mycolicibacterium phlei]|uniref:Rieske 2Fe-2S domain-containing protein n=1 Tax=Mycolicibacterium phlei TaxID=1771 RepID=UPI00025AE1A1|nr:Rieske 2Fe-2S domain-containing protein [Mycolicibacterium phlei]EID11794.1 iron-sulfur cluster-binding protein, Rieske family protein [Mycolicibacterium phlei RIVM601174]MBF4193854.1 iron-sulfur cluster-binding protein, Rieske family protein [Mycolicibacterium phlei]